MSTTETENTELVHRLHSEVWSKGNLDLVDEIVADDYVEHNPTVPHEARGPSDYKDSVERFRTGFPDLTLTEEDTIAEGDEVVSRITIRGTHAGEFMGVEPTGITVEAQGIVVNRIEDGRLVESWPLPDMMGVMEQLGVVDTAPPSTSLEDLLGMEGVLAAGEFSSDGSLVEYEANMDMSEELAATTARFCATVTMLFDTLAGAFSKQSGMDWTPQHGWMYAGGDYTVAIGGNTGVFVETEAADFNRLYEALVESPTE